MNQPSFYESDQAVSEYLLFHYGSAEETLPYDFGPHSALDYPSRCVSSCLQTDLVPADARALDLGCAVGRSSFELTRYCKEVVGIDFSNRFIEVANVLKSGTAFPYSFRLEGSRSASLSAFLPDGVHPDRVRFLQGDAQSVPTDLGLFDVVLMANLIDRLPDPARCLAQMEKLIRSRGQLIITSPYTWLEDYTPRDNQIGGTEREDTFTALQGILSPHFRLNQRLNLPFLIREHSRKYQWSVAEATTWIRS